MASELMVEGFTNVTHIAQGGTSRVYTAQNAAGVTVALKVASGTWNEKTVKRFAREQQAMMVLNGTTNVVPLLGTGETTDGSPYIEIPFYPNGSLQSRIDEQIPTSLNEALQIITTVGEAVISAHQKGIYHKDIKPGNILLDENDQPFLADFGIAQIDDGRSLTTTRTYTPGYCPPEMYTTAEVDGQSSDVYSLAATLWALLAGATPFSTCETGAAVTDQAIIFKRVACDQIGPPMSATPQRVVQVIQTAMQKDPEFRYASVGEFLGQLVSSDPVVFVDETVARPLRTTQESSSPSGKDDRLARGWVKPAIGITTAVIALTALVAFFVIRTLDNDAADSVTADTGVVSSVKPAGPTTTITTTSLPTTSTTIEATTTTISVESMRTERVLQAEVDALLPEGVMAVVTGDSATLVGDITFTEFEILVKKLDQLEGLESYSNRLVISPDVTTSTTGAATPSTSVAGTSSTRPALFGRGNISIVNTSENTFTYRIDCSGKDETGIRIATDSGKILEDAVRECDLQEYTYDASADTGKEALFIVEMPDIEAMPETDPQQYCSKKDIVCVYPFNNEGGAPNPFGN